MAAAPQEYVEVTVKQGDTLSKIAARYLSDPQAWKELLQYNKVDDPNLIFAGMKLKVPIQMASEEAKEEAEEAEKVKGPSPSAWKVTGVQGTVEQISGGQRRALAAGDAVEPGTEVESSPKSSASFLLPDNSRIRMEASTKMVVHQTAPVGVGGWKTSIRNLGGFLRAKVSKLTVSSSFEIQTPTAVAGVRGTEFSVAYDPIIGESKLAVEEGKVALKAEGKEVILEEGQGSIAKKGAPPTPPIVLLAPPVVRTVKLDDGSEALEWERPGGAVQCGFLIARDAAFAEIVRETESMANVSSNQDLQAGNYHARAFCQDQNGLRGRLSEPHEFTIE